MIAGAPRAPLEVPPVVARLAQGRPVRAVWVNEVGGVTYEVGASRDRCFVKWAPVGSGLHLAAEAARLAWAVTFAAVPGLHEQSEDRTGSWLVTAALPGENAVSPRWRASPETAVRALGEGLRALHEALPVDGCPFSWSAESRVADVQRRAGTGRAEPRRWHPVHRRIDVNTVLELLSDVPPVDQLVVCHGDSCAPNTLLSDDGRCSGHVDLGDLGTADRWADLAVATWSTEWNYGPGWERLLLDAYGVGRDPDRTRYYRLLWDLGP